MSRPNAALRVIIAEDNYLVREGTRQLLDRSGRVAVLAAVSNAEELIDAVNRLSPDAVIVDIRMPPGHRTEGIAAARTLRASHPDIGIVVLSQYATPMYAMELFSDGTDGLAYLLKDHIADRDELLRALDTVVAGGSVIDPAVVESLLARGATATSPLADLTDREIDVLGHMAQGMSNQAIAGALHLSSSSIEKHINSIFAKLALDPADAAIHRRVAAVLAFLENLDTRSAPSGGLSEGGPKPRGPHPGSGAVRSS